MNDDIQMALDEPADQIRFWNPVKGKRVFDFLRTIPVSQLNFEQAHKFQILSSRMHLKMGKEFGKRFTELQKERKQLVRSHLVPNPKSKFKHIDNIKARERSYKYWDDDEKWVFYNNLRAIPVEEMTQEICAKFTGICGALKIQPDADVVARRDKLIQLRKEANGYFQASEANWPYEQGVPPQPFARGPALSLSRPVPYQFFPPPPRSLNPFPPPPMRVYPVPFAQHPQFNPPYRPPVGAQPGPSGLSWKPSFPYQPIGFNSIQNQFVDRPREEFRGVVDASSFGSAGCSISRSPSPKRQRLQQGPRAPAVKLNETGGGAPFDLERSPEREIEEEVTVIYDKVEEARNAAYAALEKYRFEKALDEDFAIPLNDISNTERSAVFYLVRLLAETYENKDLQMTIGRCPDPTGRDSWRCDMSWCGELKWILSTVYYSPSEIDIQFGAAWEMYKLLVSMGLVPPGLFKFIGNHEARLPSVVASLAPFMKLLETSLPPFMIHPDEENNRHLLLEHMRKLFVVEWQHRTIELPSELVPCIEEQKRLPFIRVETMSDEAEQLWRLSSPHVHRMAKIMDDRSGDVTQQAPRPTEPVRPSEPASVKDDDGDDVDFEEELRQLEERCKSADNKQNCAH